MEFLSKNLADTAVIAKEILRRISETPHPYAAVLALHGELGAGKTAFVQALAKHLGVKEHITSPTFIIMKNYPPPLSPLNAKRFTLLVHIDAYRLTSGKELLALSFRELLADPEHLICIEWAEHAAAALPHDSLRIDFEFISETTRRISTQ
ncbi:MAG: hypothetical protein G01um101472_547 [Parcubacteria group bacterium Gr01-1014_72]|nr:MAG: hypothetical protein G01um101472_547 [Parcubacteria group bacterium Gr01-1014_72]